MSQHYAAFADEVPRPLQRVTRSRDARMFRRIASLAPAPRGERLRLVEIGPGRGSFAARCVASGWDYVGVEAARGPMSELRGRGLEILEGRVPPLPPLDGPVDVVVASHVVEHLLSGFEVAELLDDCRRALVTGGRIVLVYPSAALWGPLFWESDYTHHWPASERRLRQVGTDVGLVCRGAENRTLGFSGPVGATIAGFGRLIPWRLAARLPAGPARALTGMRILLAPESLMVLEVPIGPSATRSAQD